MDDDNLDNLIDELFGDGNSPQPPPTPDPSLPEPLPFPPPGGAPFLRLVDAVGHVRNNLEDGVTCPCCGQLAKQYHRKLNANMALFLVSLVRQYQRTQDWVSYRDCQYRGRDYAYVEHWGLAVTHPTSPDSKARTSGLWKPTQKGIDFVEQRVTVPTHADIYNNQVVGWAAQEISVVAALGKHFDYQELMNS